MGSSVLWPACSPAIPCSRHAWGGSPTAFPRGSTAMGACRRSIGARRANRSATLMARPSTWLPRRASAAWVRESEGTTRLFLQFHHACCDGWAAVQFIEELLVAYHLQIEGSRCGLALRPLRPDRLRDRGRLEVPPHWWARLRDLWVGARLWSGWAFRQPALLAPGRRAPAGVEPPLLDFQTVALGHELTGALRQAATAAGGSLHDVLLRDLFQSIHQWNQRQGSDDRRPIRINVPLTIRDARRPAIAGGQSPDVRLPLSRWPATGRPRAAARGHRH